MAQFPNEGILESREPESAEGNLHSRLIEDQKVATPQRAREGQNIFKTMVERRSGSGSHGGHTRSPSFIRVQRPSALVSSSLNESEASGAEVGRSNHNSQSYISSRGRPDILKGFAQLEAESQSAARSRIRKLDNFQQQMSDGTLKNSGVQQSRPQRFQNVGGEARAASVATAADARDLRSLPFINNDDLVYKGFTKQHTRGELQRLKGLRCHQKLAIILFNVCEVLPLGVSLAQNYSDPSLLTLLTLVIFVYIGSLIPKCQNLTQAHSVIQKKRSCILFACFYCVVIMLVKFSLAKTKLKGTHKYDDVESTMWFGFKYSSSGPGEYIVETAKTLVNEIVTVLACCIYLLYMYLVSQAVDEQITITRYLERYIPQNANRIGKLNQRKQNHRGAIDTSNSFLSRDGSFGSVIDGSSSMPQRLDKKSQKDLNLANYDKIIETMEENLLNHDYFNAISRPLFWIIVFLCLLDISIYQTFVQIVVFLFVTFFLLKYLHSDAPKLIQQIDKIALVIMVILMVQNFFIYAFNIPLVANYVKLPEHEELYDYLQFFGIYYKSQLVAIPEYSFLQQLNKDLNHRHLEVSSAIIAFCFIVRASISGSKLEKKIKYKQQNMQNNANQTEAQKREVYISKQNTLNARMDHNQNTNRNRDSSISQDHKYKITKSNSEVVAAAVFTLRQSTLRQSEFDGSSKMQNADELEEKTIISEIKVWIISIILIWLCRLSILAFAYMYHTCYSVVLIFWVCISFIFFESKNTLSKITLYFFLPIMLLNIVEYQICNINNLMPTSMISYPNNKYGFFRFKVPVLEVSLQMMCIILQILWIKSCENISDQETSLDKVGIRIGKYLTRNIPSTEKSALQCVIFLILPYLRIILFIILLLVGFQRVDLFHFLFLFIFVGFNTLEKQQKRIIKALVLLTSLFIIISQLYTLVDLSTFINPSLMKTMGFEKAAQTFTKWELFCIPVSVNIYILMVASLYGSILNVYSNEEQMNDFKMHAKFILREKYPKISKQLRKLVYMQHTLTVFIIYTCFYLVILLKDCSLAFWGFTILTCLLNYKELDIQTKKPKAGQETETLKTESKIKYYWLMGTYSSCLILLNITVIFCNTDYMKTQRVVIWAQSWIPQFIKNNPKLTGLIIVEPNQVSFLVMFIPYLIFFVFSIYLASNAPKWQKQREQVNYEIWILCNIDKKIEKYKVEFNKPYFQVVTDSMKSKQNLTAKKEILLELTEDIKEMELTKSRIYYSPISFGIKTQMFWPVIDMIAMYNGLLMLLIFLFLLFYWQYNLVIIFHIILQLYNFIKLGTLTKYYSQKKKQQQESNITTEAQIVQEQHAYEKYLKLGGIKIRKRRWIMHFILLALSLILIYPSQFWLEYQQHLIVLGKDQAIKNSIVETIIYYSFLAGVMHDPKVSKSLTHSIEGYIIIGFLLVIDRLCIQWLENKFDCSDQILKVILEFREEIQACKEIQNKMKLSIDNHSKDFKSANYKRQHAKKPSTGLEREPDLIRANTAPKSGVANTANKTPIEIEKDERPINLQAITRGKAPMENTQNGILEWQTMASKSVIDKRLLSAKEQQDLKQDLNQRLIVLTQFNINVGCSIFLEHLIILLLWSSALYKMNFQSILDMLVIILYTYSKRFHTIKFIMNSIVFIFFMRLLLILSNMTPDLNPMQYPVQFHDKAAIARFLFPWTDDVYPSLADKMTPLDYRQWCYWFCFLMFKGRFASYYIDFLNMLLIYTWYLKCSLWLYHEDLQLHYSPETMKMVEEYHKIVYPEGNPNPSDVPLINHSEQVQLTSQTVNAEEAYADFIKDLKSQSSIHKFNNAIIKFQNFYFSQIGLCACVFLSLIQETIFSVIYIMVISIVMHYNYLFFDVDLARSKILRILKTYVRTFMIFEFFIVLVFQIPLRQFHPGKQAQTLKYLTDAFGLTWFFEVQFDGTHYSLQEKAYKGYWLKAIVYFCVSLQIEILQSKHFEKITEYLKIGKIRGQGLMYEFNNIKIRKYLKIQMMNLRKERMMITVKEKCDQWQMQFQKEQVNKQNSISNRGSDKSGNMLLKDNLSQFRPKQTKRRETIVGTLASQLQLNYDIFQAEKEEEFAPIQQAKKDKENFFRSVNTDFLVIQKLKNNYQMDDSDDSDESEAAPEEELFEEANLNTNYKHQLKKLNFCVRFYLFLRKNLIHPIILVNQVEKINQIMELNKKGKRSPKTAIEMAIIHDNELGDNAEAFYQRLPTEISFKKMLSRYFKLFLMMFKSNLDMVTYTLMLYQTIQSPGIVSMVYPFSIFGYALLEETYPTKGYWTIMLAYTQLYTIVEFFLSLQILKDSQPQFVAETTLFMSKYYTGIIIRDFNRSTMNILVSFLPKILIMFAIISFVRYDQLYNSLNKDKEQPKERMIDAYYRYIQGKYGIDFARLEEWEEDLAAEDGEDGSFDSEEMDHLVSNYMQQYAKDTNDILESTRLPDFESDDDAMSEQHHAKSDGEMQYHKHVDRQSSASDLMGFQFDRKALRKVQQKVSETQVYQGLSSRTQRLFVDNHYIHRLFKKKKLNKPGVDLYSYQLFIQVIQCFYIIFFYPKMSYDSQSFQQQFQSNTYSGNMVLFLSVIIFFMIIDRYIYKSKTFKEQANPAQKDGSMQENLKWREKQITELKKELFYEIHHDNLEYNCNDHKSKQKLIRGLTLDQLCVRVQVDFKYVIQFYFQWVYLIFIHATLFYLIPMKGNEKIKIDQWWCEPNDTAADGKCNNLDRNNYIIIFYLINCVYFVVVACQIKLGRPDAMGSQFMMKDYNKYEKAVFMGYMFIPFIFELRTFIDWTYTATSLDVFQWIKLAKIQADLYKAKAINRQYFAKPVGKAQLWWYKMLVGLLGIIGIVSLIIGPMFIFSTFLIQYGDPNPITKSTITVGLEIRDQANSPSQYQLFQTSNILKNSALTDDQFNLMGLNQNQITLTANNETVQYLIFNYQPTETWIISNQMKRKIIEQFSSVLNRWTVYYENDGIKKIIEVDENLARDKYINLTDTNKILYHDGKVINETGTVEEIQKLTAEAVKEYKQNLAARPKDIKIKTEYQFTRSQPASSTVVSKRHDLILYNQTFEVTPAINQFIKALNTSEQDRTQCQNEAIDVNYTNIEFGSNNSFNPVIYLDSTKIIQTLYNSTWEKTMYMHYDYCLNVWVLKQNFQSANCTKFPEKCVFAEITDNQKVSDYGLSFFVMSKRLLPSAYFNMPLMAFYISIVYLISKTFRAAFVPATERIWVEECKDPIDILMLCDTIHLYRLKKMIKEEEQLYYLLIDILRTPQVLKAITGTSLRNDEEEDENEAMRHQIRHQFSVASAKPRMGKSVEIDKVDVLNNEPYRKSQQFEKGGDLRKPKVKFE